MIDNPADLNKLHDIVVPDAVSWWPLAPGWWLLMVAIAVVGTWVGIRQVRKWRANAYRRAALAALESAQSPVEIGALLRRVALAISPRDTIASLKDDEWIRWLDERSPLAVPREVESSLTRSLYAPDESPTATDALREFAGEWIRQHARPC